MNEQRLVTRRRFLITATATGAGAAVTWGSPLQSAAAHAGFAREFARPGADVRAKFRWWWPHGKVDPAEIRREVDQIAAAGFGGAEIADVHHSVEEPIDPAHYGWGTPAWVAAVETALRRAKERGITLDITIGPSWPAAVPTVTPDSKAAIKELAHGTETVAAGTTYDGPVPPPVVPAAPGVAVQDVLVVQAARISTGAPAAPIPLDLDSVQDLTGRVEGGRLRWTAPDDGGQWLVIGYWERGSGQLPERGPHSDPESYVVDHFSRAGTQAVIDFWESRLLTPAIRRLLRDAGGALFEDSIELETDATNWTPGLLAEFERRRGYSLLPYLPAVVEQDEDPVFTFDAQLSRHVRRDFWECLSQIFIDNHFKPLKAWAHSLGLQLRTQPYGLETDAIAVAALIDIPEGESLGFRNLDDYRCLAGGRDMGRSEPKGRILSNEAAAFAGGAYNTTWDRVLKTLNPQFAAGVNQTVLHGFSYAAAPGAAWPGFAAFTPYDGGIGYAESWGPRQPTWRHVADVADYFGRVQLVMRTGTPKADVAILRQRGYTKTGLGAPWFSADGVPVGWTHQFLSPALLRLPSATVSGGRLAPRGPAYKVLVFEGDIFGGRERTLQIDTAERLLVLAMAGLPIVVVGDWADASVPGVGRTGDDERLRALVAELVALPSVRRVADRPNIPEALADLGIQRDVEYAQRSTLLNARRVDGRTDYYYLCNGSATAPVDHDVWLTATSSAGRPYRLDAWTGEIERMARYERAGNRIRVRVTLRPGQSAIIAIGDRARFGDRGRPDRDLDNAAAVELSSWRLTVEDWRPGGTPTETTIFRHELTLDGLRPWPEIPELRDVSGIGRYRATVEFGGAGGAYLELGEVLDTFRVTVNGRRLPPGDRLNPVVDVGPYLRRGTNSIEVEVATTLNNRLRVADPGVYGLAKPQRYGLIGPVRLVPYGHASIRT